MNNILNSTNSTIASRKDSISTATEEKAQKNQSSIALNNLNGVINTENKINKTNTTIPSDACKTKKSEPITTSVKACTIQGLNLANFR